jgi:hypothetical protein
VRTTVSIMDNAWTREIEDIARELDVDLHTGLTNTQVQTALSKYGKNGICHPYMFC